MTAAAGPSTAFARHSRGIGADYYALLAARVARPGIAVTTVRHTSGKAARAHADHAQWLNTAKSVSWFNEQVSSSGGARPGRGAGWIRLEHKKSRNVLSDRLLSRIRTLAM
jgi:hypothetical protein